MPRRIVANPSSSKQRSAVTNSVHRLPGVNMRSAAGRRWRDLVDSVIAQFGDSNTEAIRELVGLKFTLEQTQAAAVAGDPKARTDIVRLSRLIEKKESVLRQSALAARVKAQSDVAWSIGNLSEEG
jgi:hypothetical protein